MRNILYIFGFCCLLAMGFTACQTEEPLTLEQQSQFKKRDSKKHPKLEYVTSSVNNSASTQNQKQSSRLKYTLKNSGDALQVFFKLDSYEPVFVTISDKDTCIIATETYLKEGREFVINPAAHYPYRFSILSASVHIFGIITEQ